MSFLKLPIILEVIVDKFAFHIFKFNLFNFFSNKFAEFTVSINRKYLTYIFSL